MKKKIFSKIHGIELNSINILISGFDKLKNGQYKPYNLDLYNDVKNRWDLIAVYNTDSHSSLCVGTIGNQISCSKIPGDEEELAHVLKTKKIEQFQNTKVLSNFMKRF